MENIQNLEILLSKERIAVYKKVGAKNRFAEYKIKGDRSMEYLRMKMQKMEEELLKNITFGE